MIDDASTDGTCASIKKLFPNANMRLFRFDRERLISDCRNFGLDNAKGEYILFIDDDVIISSETISELLIFLSKNEDVACAMPMILYRSNPNTIWCAGVEHNPWTTVGRLVGKNEEDRGQYRREACVDSVITTFMVRKSCISEIRFDSKAFPIGWEDMDFAASIRNLGFEVVVLPWVKVLHDYSSGNFLKSKLRLYFEVRNRILFHRKWSDNALKYVISVASSLLVGLSYMLIGMRFSSAFIGNARAILRAIVDGMVWRRRGTRFQHANGPTKRMIANRNESSLKLVELDARWDNMNSKNKHSNLR